jgi:hypothetical protein
MKNLMGLGQKEDKRKEMGEKKGICYEVLLCCQNWKTGLIACEELGIFSAD